MVQVVKIIVSVFSWRRFLAYFVVYCVLLEDVKVTSALGTQSLLKAAITMISNFYIREKSLLVLLLPGIRKYNMTKPYL